MSTKPTAASRWKPRSRIFTITGLCIIGVCAAVLAGIVYFSKGAESANSLASSSQSGFGTEARPSAGAKDSLDTTGGGREVQSLADRLAASPSEVSPEQLARNDQALALANSLKDRISDSEFRNLVQEANQVAMIGADSVEQELIVSLIAQKRFDEAQAELLRLADRPGGVSTSGQTNLGNALREAGKPEQAEAFEAAISLRTVETLERIESLGLGVSAPDVYQITFWRTNAMQRSGSPAWVRARESLVRVGRSIPPESRASNASYVRSLGQWAQGSLEAQRVVEQIDASRR
jgi:hypothetical protein